MPKKFTPGSDGGSFYPTSDYSTQFTKIGYTDGTPFQSSNIYPTTAVAKPGAQKVIIPNNKILGYTYGYMAERGAYRTPMGIQSQDLMYELGNNWVCLAIANYQKTFYSTDIYADYRKTPSDRDIEFFVTKAHSNNVKVCLKPMLNSEDNMWRAHIGFPDLNMSDMDIYWEKWFNSYTAYMLHYAQLAAELKCEMLCIGCEMLGTEHRKNDWLRLIDQIRAIYSGKIVYNTNHDHEDAVEWFDVLDYIGTSAYYPVGAQGCTKEKMIEEWTKIKWRLNAIAESRHKQYIFMEVGCRSAAGCAAMPWDFTQNQQWNEDEQALFYETCMEVFMDEPNFAGVFWWDWSTYIYNDRQSAQGDLGYNIHLKKAEKLVKDYYKKYKN